MFQTSATNSSFDHYFWVSVEEEPEQTSLLEEAEEEFNGALLHDLMDDMELLMKEEMDPDNKMTQLWSVASSITIERLVSCQGS